MVARNVIEPLDWKALDQYWADCGLLWMDIPFIDAVQRCRARLTYLATPYAKISLNMNGQWCPVQSEMAAFQAAKWATHIAANGASAVSPVVQSAAIVAADTGAALDPLDDVFWRKWCAPLLRASGAVIIPPIDGWKVSLGIWREACAALEASKPVFVIRKGSEYGGGE